MPFQPLNLAPDYMCDTWSLDKALREIIANAMDAAVKTGIKMEWKYEPDKKRLIVENRGTTINRGALRIGASDKRGDERMIGQFGEGFKLALPVLMKYGISIIIRNGSEVWTPCIRFSKALQSDEIGVDIQDGNTYKERVRFELTGITAEDWEDVQAIFLCFHKKAPEIVAARNGDILLDAHLAGKVFVKGALIKEFAKLQKGYNFREGSGVKLGRDRNMVDEWDLGWAIKDLWADALQTRPDLFPSFKALLDVKAGDVDGITSYSPGNFGEAVVDRLEQEFKKQYGDKTIPVATNMEFERLEECNRPAVVNERLSALLSKRFKPVAEIEQETKNAAVRNYGWHELTGKKGDQGGESGTEKGTLYQVERLVQLVMPSFKIANVDVVDFHANNPGLLGIWDGDKKKILVARKVLGDVAETLATVCHELGHIDGSRDGDRGHAFNVESLLSRIVVKVLELAGTGKMEVLS